MNNDFGINTYAADYCDGLSMVAIPAAVDVLRRAVADHKVESVTPNSLFCPGCHTSITRDRGQGESCIALAAAVAAGWRWPTRDEYQQERARWRAAEGAPS